MKTIFNLNETRVLSNNELGEMKGGAMEACRAGCEPGCLEACKPGSKYVKEEVKVEGN